MRRLQRMPHAHVFDGFQADDKGMKTLQRTNIEGRDAFYRNTETTPGQNEI